jgi:NTE family protein
MVVRGHERKVQPLGAAAGLNADLVLEGGGVKGIGLVGAYLTLVEHGYRIQRVAGTSAGAIVGALIAADMPPDLMLKTMREVDYGAFQDEGFLDHFGAIGKGLSVQFEKGIYEGDYLSTWLDDLLSELGKATFGDLRIDDPGSALPPEQSYRLVVHTSDISCGRLVRLPWDYPLYGLDPDKQRVADAVRASMSIPFFYEPVRFKGRRSDGSEIDSYLVDGGMLSNFPITVFDRSDGKAPRWPTFGVKLSARPTSPVEERFCIGGALGLAKAMVGTMMRFHDQMHIDDPAVLARTMFVDTLGVKATDFDIDDETQVLLYENGRSATAKFLHGGGSSPAWDFAEYIQRFRAAEGSKREVADNSATDHTGVAVLGNAH